MVKETSEDFYTRSFQLSPRDIENIEMFASLDLGLSMEKTKMILASRGQLANFLRHALRFAVKEATSKQVEK